LEILSAKVTKISTLFWRASLAAFLILETIPELLGNQNDLNN